MESSSYSITLLMPYSLADLPTTHSAARKAPTANMVRDWATCLIVIVSPGPLK